MAAASKRIIVVVRRRCGKRGVRPHRGQQRQHLGTPRWGRGRAVARASSRSRACSASGADASDRCAWQRVWTVNAGALDSRRTSAMDDCWGWGATAIGPAGLPPAVADKEVQCRDTGGAPPSALPPQAAAACGDASSGQRCVDRQLRAVCAERDALACAVKAQSARMGRLKALVARLRVAQAGWAVAAGARVAVAAAEGEAAVAAVPAAAGGVRSASGAGAALQRPRALAVRAPATAPAGSQQAGGLQAMQAFSASPCNLHALRLPRVPLMSSDAGC